MNRTKLLMSALFASAMLIAGASKAQSVKGKNFVNAGIGIGTFGFSGTGGLPIVASYEHGFSDKISGGVYAGFISRKFATHVKYSYVVAGVRASYHFNEILNVENSKIDLYGGAALYYRHFKAKFTDTDGEDFNYKSSGGDLGIGIYVAGRYRFSESLGAFAELGYGVSPLQLGVSFMF